MKTQLVAAALCAALLLVYRNLTSYRLKRSPQRSSNAGPTLSIPSWLAAIATRRAMRKAS